MHRRIFLAALILPVFAFGVQAALASFPDVFQSTPFADSINYVQEKGIVSGYPNGLFRPDWEINRAEFTKILIKTKYNEDQISQCHGALFSDVDEKAWFAPYVCKAKEAGVIAGYPDGSFKPESPINFAEAAKIIVMTLRQVEFDAKQYQMDLWYEPYIRILGDNGALPLQVFGPESQVSRGLMAELIYRLNEKVTNKDSYSFEEFGDRMIIENYYNILGWDAAKAYEMKSDPAMSFADFEKLYPRDAASYHVVNFKKVAAHTYDFYVWTTYAPNEQQVSGLYHVMMSVIGGKIKTDSAAAVASMVLEELKYNDVLSAKIVWDGGKLKVYVIQGSVETMVAEYEASETIIKNLSFSRSGGFVNYQLMGWEYGGVLLYDIANKKLSDGPYDGIDVYGFTTDEKYFYFCSESGMSSGEAFVLNLDDFTVRRNLVDSNESIESCDGFDAANNWLYYTVRQEWGATGKRVYDIVNDLINYDA